MIEVVETPQLGWAIKCCGKYWNGSGISIRDKRIWVDFKYAYYFKNSHNAEGWMLRIISHSFHSIGVLYSDDNNGE